MTDRITKNRVSLSIKITLTLFHLSMFLLIYTGNNIYAEHIKTTSQIIITSDLKIPFIEWMIIPYLSSILYLLLAFLCISNPKKYKIFNQNMTLSLLISGWCFYLFPLYFGTYNIEVNYPWSIGFDWILLFDRPYNQAPSLHVIYGIIVWFSLREQFSRTKRFFIAIGILFMLASTLFTYQHHIVDVMSGSIVAIGILWFTRFKLLSYLSQIYLLLASSCLLLGMILIKFNVIPSLFLFYLSTVFFVLFLAYSFNRANFLGKRHNGKVWMLHIVFLFPYRFTYWVMWRIYLKFDKHPVISIYPWLSVGRKLSNMDNKRNFTHIIDLSSELSSISNFHYDNTRLSKYKYIPLLDLQPIAINEALVFCKYLSKVRNSNKEISVYVHCSFGISRSYAMIASYLVWSGQYKPYDIKSYLSSINPNIILRDDYLQPHMLRRLVKLSQTKYERKTNDVKF